MKFSLIFCLIPIALLAQESNGRLARIDSLKSIQTNDKKIQYKVFRELVNEYADFNNEIALRYANRAFDLSIDLTDSSLIASSARVQGTLLKRLGRITESIKKSEYAYGIAVRNNLIEVLSEVYSSMPIPHIFNGNYERALQILFESLEFFEKYRYLERKSYALNNVGLVFFRMENYTKALDYFTQSLTLRKKLNVDYDIVRLLTNMAQCHLNLNRHQQAIKLIEEGLWICKSSCSTPTKIEIFLALGEAHYGLHNLKTSEYYYTKAYLLSRIDNNQDSEAASLLLLGRIALKRNQYKTAENHLTAAEKIKIKNPETGLSIYKELIKLYSATASPKLAEYQTNYIELKTKIYSASLTEKLSHLQSKHAEEANKVKLSQQREILELTDSLVSRRYFMVGSIVLVGILLLILLGLLIWTNVEKNRLNEGLERLVDQHTADLDSACKVLVANSAIQSARLLDHSNQLNQYVKSLLGFKILQKEENSAWREEMNTIVAKMVMYQYAPLEKDRIT